jgi:hypothetical protein
MVAIARQGEADQIRSTNMISVSANEVQKDLARYVREAAVEPVEVKHGGRREVVSVFGGIFQDLLSSYRRSKPVEELSDEDVALIQQAKAITGRPYNLNESEALRQAADHLSKLCRE